MQIFSPNAPNAFQSTLSVRRATRQSIFCHRAIGISIHALRKESDMRVTFLTRWWKHFNPRSP